MTSLRELAGKISTIADILEHHKASQSENDVTGSRSWLQTLPPELSQKRLDLVDTLQELKRQVQSVESSFEDVLFSYTDTASLQVLYALKLPQHIPIGKSTSYSTISQACGISEPILRRLFRYAITNQIFTEPEPGRVAHSDISQMLLTNPDAFDAMGMTLEELMPASQHLLTALRKYPQTREPNETAYNVANNTDLSIYQFLEKNPERARRFGAAMRYFTQGDHMDLRHLLEAFPWHEYDREGVLMVDIGGGQGAVTCRLASATKHMRYVVQDLEQAVSAGKEMLPKDLHERVEFMAHDFFTEQPMKGADVYFFRWILHNWSDDYCIRILRALIPAMKTGAKVLLYEHVLSDVPDARLSRKGGRYLDMVMLTCWNGCIRTENDWRQLFGEADSRFKVEGIKKGPGNALSLIEVTWVTESVVGTGKAPI